MDRHSNGKVDIYKLSEELGHGGFATVDRITDAKARSYALKAKSQTTLADAKALKKRRADVALHCSLDHPTIVRFHDFFEDKQHSNMSLEYWNGCPVRQMVREKGHRTEAESVLIFRDLIGAICYLDDNRMVDCDPKVENFLIASEGKVRVGDFGLSAKLNFNDDHKFTPCRPPNELSREMIASASCRHADEVDIWAIGVCAFAIRTGILSSKL
jgi:polo-like kinase 1